MRLVLQRVKEAVVKVEGEAFSKIGRGILIFVAVAKGDSFEDVDYLAEKTVNLRIFEDSQGKMNVSASDRKAEFLIVSQFTLLGDCAQGRRPSFDEAADPKKAEEFYGYFVQRVRDHNLRVETGKFRAMMQVSLINDGPVTFILDSRDKRH
jgi:D-tyrosyl-tRNA(Tyr) deacylase